MGKKRKMSLIEEFHMIYIDNPLLRAGEHNPPLCKDGLLIVTSFQRAQRRRGGKRVTCQ